MNESAILLSVKPRYATKIFTGEKNIELRRVLPKKIANNSLVIVYASRPLKKIIGLFRVKRVQTFEVKKINKNLLLSACIDKEEAFRYFHNKKYGQAIYIGDKWRVSERSLKFRFKKNRKFKAPQSFYYLDINEIDLTGSNIFI